MALEPIVLRTVASVLRARPCTAPTELGPAPMIVHVKAAAATACECEPVGWLVRGLLDERLA